MNKRIDRSTTTILKTVIIGAFIAAITSLLFDGYVAGLASRTASAQSQSASTGSDSRARFDFLVRADFFAGFAGDQAALERGMKVCCGTRPGSVPEAAAWVLAGVCGSCSQGIVLILFARLRCRRRKPMSATRGVITLVLTSAAMLMWPERARQNDEAFQDRAVTIAGTEYHFRVFTPKGWSKKRKSPMILFLHGAGERGEDNLAQTKVGIGPAILHQQESLPFIVVLPQCPKDRWWTEPDMQALALKALDQTTKELNADPKRTYLTGLSMGGYGSWVIVANNPARFAALAVVCGGVRPPPRINIPEANTGIAALADPYAAVAAKVGKTPVWVFHGGADPVVPVSESRKMVEAIKAAHGNVRYNEYGCVGHNSWDKAYAEPELFSWFLSPRKK